MKQFVMLFCAALLSSILTVSMMVGGAYYVWQSGKWLTMFAPGEQSPLAESQSVEVVLNVEDLREMREKLTSSERASLFAKVVKKVPPNEIEQLSAWLESGLTASEIRQIKRLSERYFTPKEMEEIMRWME